MNGLVRLTSGVVFVALIPVALIVQLFPFRGISSTLGEIMSKLLSIFLGPISL